MDVDVNVDVDVDMDSGFSGERVCVVSLDCLQSVRDQRARVAAGKQRICLPLDLHQQLRPAHTQAHTHRRIFPVYTTHQAQGSRSCAAHDVGNGNEIQNENDRKFVTPAACSI